MKIDRPRKGINYFFKSLAGTPTKVAFAGILVPLVTTEPAPERALAPIVTGATRTESEPMKAPLPILVTFLFFPS